MDKQVRWIAYKLQEHGYTVVERADTARGIYSCLILQGRDVRIRGVFTTDELGDHRFSVPFVDLARVTRLKVRVDSANVKASATIMKGHPSIRPTGPRSVERFSNMSHINLYTANNTRRLFEPLDIVLDMSQILYKVCEPVEKATKMD
ncbi:hypothetical protein BDV96DRAFT_641258 [Lophiotrema nucula]|uniref:Uncharacterized protein n=1 Tax=Lophiotrema nucula TaxID=690887 RepID=A0A6A5ZNZ4_9PLEO|nr:hypothetical protein BDV96DRAFT_641258 [Lophiotrema nucula]